METELIWMKDSYVRSVEADILEMNGREVLLSRTVLYPGGGGLVEDKGTVNSIPVTGYRKEGGKLWHVLEKEAENRKALVQVEWERRYGIMKAHTAAHILASVIYRKFGALISGNKVEPGQFRMDFNVDDFDRGKFEEAVAEANELASRGKNVRVYEMPYNEAMKIEGVVKLLKGLEHLKIVRIVEIEGIDIQADGGVHVANTGEIGRMEITKVENKGRANRRVYIALK
ncbi:MAG: alanyl-tRNA editing protein [Candidatus Anstonellales archaeon]